MDPAAEIIEIEGIRYSFELFRHLGLAPTDQDMYLQLTDRHDGVLTIRQFTRADLIRRFANGSPPLGGDR